MLFPPLVRGRLVRRYKRFLADVELEGGEVVTAHTANPGRMIGLTEPGRTVYLSESDNPKRKLRYTWELLRIGPRLVGINPAKANPLVAEALAEGLLSEVAAYDTVRPEVRYGERGSRVDFLLSDSAEELPDCYLEVKNVTLYEEEGALFPDAVTERGRKHLLELRDMAAAGHRSVLCFLVQRPEPTYVGPARRIDPAYAETLDEVAAAGVELIAYRVSVSTKQLKVRDPLPIRL